MEKEKSVCVKIYLKPELFAEITQEAEKAGIRRKGLLLYTEKPHGFANEKLANTDRIAQFLKFCFRQYLAAEADRIEKMAQIRRQEQDIAEQKKRLGI